MAASVFVPGPGANPNIGSPAQYLSNISQLANSRRADSRARDTLEQNKIFKQAAIDQTARSQDYIEAAPQRAEDLRLNNLALEADKLSTVKNHAEGAQYAGGDRFTTIDQTLMKDPRYAQLDEPGRLAARNEYINKNPSALTPPKQFVDTLRAGLIQSGKFSGDELEKVIGQEVKRRYPTADPDIVGKLFLKPKDLIGAGNTNINIGGGQRSSGSGSFDFVSDPTSPKERGNVVERISSIFNLPNTPTTVPGAIPFIGGKRVDFGDLDPSKQDVSQAVSLLTAKGINSPTAQEAALNIAFNPDGTIKKEYDWRSTPGLNKLVKVGNTAQNTEERIFNKKGGDVSAAGSAAGVNSPAGAANAAQEYNNALMASLTPRAKDDSEIVSNFLDSLGAAPNQAPPQDIPRQGGNQGGSTNAPPAVVPVPVPDPGVTNTSISPVPDPQSNLSLVGGDPTAKLFSGIKDNLSPVTSVLGFSPGKAIFDKAAGLFQQGKNFLPQGDDIAQFGRDTVPFQGKEGFYGTSPREERQKAVDVLSGPERTQALDAAHKLAREGKINIADADGEGNNRDEALLIAYLKYVEGKREQP